MVKARHQRNLATQFGFATFARAEKLVDPTGTDDHRLAGDDDRKYLGHADATQVRNAQTATGQIVRTKTTIARAPNEFIELHYGIDQSL